jgi:hypothetical protein
MIKSVRSGFWCCQLFALIGCAGVKVGPGLGADAGVGGAGGGVAIGGQTGAGGRGGAPVIIVTDGGKPADAPTCGYFKPPVDRLPPDVLIVLDRSLSMEQQVLPVGFTLADFALCILLNNCPMTASRWVTMVGALNSSVMASAADVNYGLKFFPNDLGCGVSDAIAVPIAANNFGPMNAAMAMTQPGGSTPTAAALASAGRYLMSLTRPNPRFVLLATDGEPTCGAGGDTMNSDAQTAIDAVTKLAAAGIPVYVIGIATAGVADMTLNAMAMAGGKPRTGTPAYYSVQNATDLSAALAAIGKDVASCTFNVTPPPPPADPTNVVVDANGMRVPANNPADGWRWGPNMATIEITGSWCARIQSGEITDIQTTFACKGVVIE